VVIKTSSSREVAALVGDLGSPREVTRESAIARLTVIGARAVERVSNVARNSNCTATERVAALKVLGAIGDSRALQCALEALAATDDGVILAAVGIARQHLRDAHGADAVDRLTRLALDVRCSATVRAAAVEAMADLGPTTIAPLVDSLKKASDNTRGGLVDAGLSAGAVPQGAGRMLEWAAEGRLPNDADVLRRAIARAGKKVSLTVLQQLIDRIRERERREPSERRAAWTVARAAAHGALAARGSRVALYDLRESFELADTPLPVELLTAVTAVGDAECLPSLAVAFARADSRAAGDWWRQHLAAAFRAIATRERITRRHGVMKKILKRWPGIIESRWSVVGRR
jgi:hypothetical protein